MRLTNLRLPALALPVLIGATVGVNAQSTAAIGNDGWFVRGELGVVTLGTNEGYWWGPGGPPGDPRITFSLNDPMTFTTTGGVGYDWGNGVRVDATAGITGGLRVDGTFQSASDGTTAGHATDIHAPVTATTLLGNLYIEPFRLAGHDMPVQPFLTGGVGMAFVTMGEWNRNAPVPPATHAARSWNGSSQTNFAWTAGAGVSIALEDLIGGGGFLDLTYRYADLGQAQGGGVSTGPGASSPTEPFNFRLTSHAVTLGLRIPLGY